MKKYTPQDLIDFENEVCKCFKNKEILSPVHLYHGNEEQMLTVFKHILPDDWVFCSWRSHYQCLLKGVPPNVLLSDIKKGQSIALNYPEYKIFSSAIVTGNIPIANGIALSIKQQRKSNCVFCFVGDMTAETGCFHENYKYSKNHDLPIKWVIEDNNKSVCTNTRKTWNQSSSSFDIYDPKILYYTYESKYPHAGIGERIQF